MQVRKLTSAIALISVLGCSGSSEGPRSSLPENPGAALLEAPDPTPIADRYRGTAQKIVAAALADTGAWTKLTYLTDRIGHRLSGSPRLERAVAWAIKAMKDDGHENVRAEKVMVPHWVRGPEAAEMLAPVAYRLHILGLGGTVATPPAGLEAEVVVVSSFEELGKRAAEIKGKIVLFNAKMPAPDWDKGAGYGDTVKFRWAGPSAAARAGAVAALVRSVTHTSLRSPHTGSLGYDEKAPKIPAAAVTTEDADLMARLAAAGQTVKVRLLLSGKFLPDAESANVIGELRGREKPEEIVLLGAHLDSWDVGQGAHDDGAGCVIMMQALTLLRKMNLRPRRTVRVVLFTNEENGGRGSEAYAKEHAAEIPHHVMALEADMGSFAPRGFKVQSSGKLPLVRITDILTLTGKLGAMKARQGYGGADIMPLAKQGVPALGLWMDDSTYFDYHHTHADTLDKVSPEHLAQNLALVATVVYTIADMPERLGGPYRAPAGETKQ